MAQIFEMGMLVCFGLSWPFNIAKSLRSRTARGKSLQFEVCVVIGYLLGIAGKIVGNNITYVMVVYVLDLTMVLIDIMLTCRNYRLDRLAERKEAAGA